MAAFWSQLKQHCASFTFRFEGGLVLFLVVWFIANSFFEKTSVGKWIAGHPTELYPMSTFSVFLMPRLTGATMYTWEIIPKAGDTPIPLSAYHMFHPIPEAYLEDEITFQLIDHLAESIRAQCPEYQTFGYKYCRRDPSATFQLQPDMAAMMDRSIEHHLGLKNPPAEARFYRIRYQFDPQHYHVTQVVRVLEMSLNPQDGWTGHVPALP